MSDEGFRRGQHVTVEVDGKTVDGVFGRQAERGDPGDVPGSDVRTVGWVRRSDTGEIERFSYSEITAKPAADIRIAIGEPSENMHHERRLLTTTFAEALRAKIGLSVDLEITERQPTRVGLGPVEWTSVSIGAAVPTTRITDLVNDISVEAKQLLIAWKAKGGRPVKGLVIYGPDGAVLCRWDTQHGDHNGEEGWI